MEFVAGRNVRQVLLAGHQNKISMPLSCGLRIVDNVAAGLNHAHEHRDVDGNPLQIVHRDVSPSNVLVTYDGNIKLVDFGIAKIAAKGPATVAGSLKGKVSYMSPEQCRGELVDRRSDIFSLGTLLWELTTGRKLFGLETQGLELLRQVERAEIPPPTSLLPDYPPELEAIVLRAMERDREDRYSTAQEFRNALEDFTLKHQIPLSSSRLSAHMETLFPRRNHESVSFVSSLPPVPADESSGPSASPSSPGKPSAAAAELFAPEKAPTATTPASSPESHRLEALEQPMPVASGAEIPEETSEPKTLVADRTEERDRTEVSMPEPEPVEAERSRRSPVGMWAAAAVLLAVGGGTWWNTTRTPATPRTEPVQLGEATAQSETVADSNTEKAGAPEQTATAHMPVMLADLRKLGYAERHARLATQSGKVAVELHVGLDLVQAGDSESPCRTFSDALTIIRGSERPRAFLWALREAEAPTGKNDACKNLGARLKQLRDTVEPAAATVRQTRRNKKKKSRPRPGRNRPAPVTPTPPESTPTNNSVAQPPPKKGVATKLDEGDDLRGI